MPSDQNDLILFRPALGTSVVGSNDEAKALQIGLDDAQQTLFQILPIADISLTSEQKLIVERERLSRIVMDAAGAAAMRCENPEIEEKDGQALVVAGCPFALDCSLYSLAKHPAGQLCPFEVDYLRERFVEWLREFGRDLSTIQASERLAIGNLCSLQLELQRTRRVLARARNAEMNQVSVRDVNAENGKPICWENIIHTAAQREDQILLDIRMIMKDFELTPEQKTKRAKALGIRGGDSLASRQSGLFDKIRANRAAKVVDVTPETIS